MKPVIKYVKHYKSSNTKAHISAYVLVKNNPAIVNLEYSLDNNNWNSIVMYHDGNHNDGEANDNNYGATILEISQNEEVIYQIYANDTQGNTNLLPCDPIVIPATGDNTFLFINEFMASSDNTIADENGNFSDWIEIFNGTETAVWMGNKFLTDNLDSPDKWQMPDFTLAVGEFVMFWADGNPDDGDSILTLN